MPLLKSKITKLEMHSDEWKKEREGRMTSSKIFSLAADNGFGEVALSYIKDKVGETLTGLSSEREVDTDATRHGLMYEPKAITLMMQEMGLEWCITQKMIIETNGKFSSTPDVIILHSETEDKLAYNVSTAEVKCPPTFKEYISLFLCESPLDLKKHSKQYYFQILDQMLICEALIGYLVIYHPEFKMGGFKILEFKKSFSIIEKGKTIYPIRDDMDLLKKRKELALIEFERIRAKLLGL